jgi:hypothetical protein
MKIMFDLNGRKHLMTPEQASQVIALIHEYGAEVYESRSNWNTTKVESHHVYSVTPTELGVGEMRYMTDAMYGMAKLLGKPE